MRQSICITGGVGSGKSTVATWLADKCQLHYLNADLIVSSLLDPGCSGWKNLKTVLNPSYYKNDTSIDKSKLRQAIFASSHLRQNVEKILHPLVHEELVRQVDYLKTIDGRRCLIEIPLLFEVGWQDNFWKVIVVYADQGVCVDRIKKRDKQTESQAKAILKTQLALKKKALAADWVIDNSTNWSFTLLQIKQLQRIIFITNNS